MDQRHVVVFMDENRWPVEVVGVFTNAQWACDYAENYIKLEPRHTYVVVPYVPAGE